MAEAVTALTKSPLAKPCFVIKMRNGYVRTEEALDEGAKIDLDMRIDRRTEAQNEVDAYAAKFCKSRYGKPRSQTSPVPIP